MLWHKGEGIIEYERNKNDNLINQAISYLK